MSEKNEVMPIDQHPYVQNLAQIARNAVDRVIELEQASARDNIAFKQLLAQRDALLEALQDIVDFVDGPAEAKRPDVFFLRISKARAAIKAVEEGENHAKSL